MADNKAIEELIRSLQYYMEEMDEFGMGSPRLFANVAPLFDSPTLARFAAAMKDYESEIAQKPTADTLAHMAPNILVRLVAAIAGEDISNPDDETSPT